MTDVPVDPPKWRRDFPYTSGGEDDVTRREFTRYLVLASGTFAAGTVVATRDGRKPIETLKVGDLILSQDVATGRLAYEPVVAVYHNPPASTLEVRLDDDAVVATTIHRFWTVGKGWTMARDLKPGDLLRVVGGPRRVVWERPRQGRLGRQRQRRAAGGGLLDRRQGIESGRLRRADVGEHGVGRIGTDRVESRLAALRG